VRSVQVEIPASETAPDAMLVLEVREGNGFGPNDVSHRFSIAPDQIASNLAMSCEISGRSRERPELNAGESVTLHCAVDNTGVIPTRIELVTERKGAAPIPWPERPVRGRDHVDFEVPIVLPSDLAIDSTVEIAVTARDVISTDIARTTILGVIRKPNPCISGRLSREQYREKIAQLRAAVAEGSMTSEQFDRYDAALVACLR
jgi:hypothetical protein